MKKPTFYKTLIAVLFLLLSLQSFGQVLKTFAKRQDENLKGDILVIGNNILNRDYGTAGNRANDSYDVLGAASVYNESIDLKWINVDSDSGNNFNSSSADLSIPAPSQACYGIVYAGLYWSGTYTNANRSTITNVRLKTPTSGYKPLTGTVIYDYVGNSTANSARNPYACYVDITAEVKAGKEGTYTLANIASSEGGSGTSAGHSAGWSIFVIYEDPNLPSKYITSYDGFTRIKNGDPAFTFPINGFKTIPSGAVDAKFAFAALEGDNKDNGDAMTIKGNTIAGSTTGRLFCALRPASTGTTNFFNSTINDGDLYFTNRNPKSKNTFGYDTGVLKLPNSGNTVIKNGETGADITLSTSNDWYYLFFTALSVEVIEPKVILTKIVQDAARTDIGGQTVPLGAPLYYEIGYKNIGNDNVGTVDTNGNPYPCILKDVLPENVNFSLSDIDLTNSGGVVVKSYDPVTRIILFQIPSTSLKANGTTEYKIRFKVQVVSDCSELKNACTNSIDNTAELTYVGEVNKAIVNDLSYDSYIGCKLVPKASNFLVNVAPCIYKQEIPYCGNQITLVAKPGYQTYSWSNSATGLPVLQTGPSNTYTTNTPGTYYVNDITTIVPCKSIQEELKVTDIKAIPNPLLDYAKAPYRGTIDICQIGGQELPKFFLCRATDHRQIITNYGLGSTALWQKLDETSCVTPPDPGNGKECANKNAACNWNTVGTGKDFDAKDAGQYKVTFSFAGGCVLVYYFNVYKNELNPTVEKENEFCTTKGSIKIKNVPLTGYEFSLDSGTFQDSPDFLSVVAGNHNVQIRLKAVGAASCDFTINNIDITKNAMVVAVNNLVQPKCSTDKGSFTVQAQNVRGPYTFELYLGATLVESQVQSGVGGFNDANFIGKAPGNYTLVTKTNDGCFDSRSVIINTPPTFTATAAVKPLTCNDGSITVTPQGGVPTYYYYVNSTTVFGTDPVIPVVSPGGVYNIMVRDGNDCRYDIPQITVNPNPKPIYSVVPTNILCYGSSTGAINFNVTSNTSGYTLAYSIDGGTTYSNNPVFSNLVANTVYSPKFKYSLNGVDCIDTLPTITLTQPATALTASAGVSELAGCGPAREGKVRITNPQGGTPFPAPNYYLYSFDNQATWVTVNDAYKAPGTYTLYIKDANGCIFAMPGIIIDPEPLAPIIGSAPVIVYGCDGKATSTVTVTNPASATYDYTYSIDGTLNTPPTSNVFTGVTAGDHIIRVNYILKSVSTFSNLLNENFGYGDDTTSPGINTSFYCFERQVAATQCKGSTAINDGDYSVTAFIVNPFGAWIQSGDHTAPTSPVTPKGRSLVVNIGDQIATSDILYQKVINNIIPNQPINFELYAKNLLKTGNTQVDADLRVALVDASGTEISWFATGGIPKTQNWEKYPNTAITLDPGANTSLKFIVRSNKRETSGNDVAIDDIRVYQLPKACVNFKDISVIISNNQGFSAQVTGTSNISCAAGSDGSITIAAQNFDPVYGIDYSLNNGTTWTNAKPDPITSSVTITGLGAGTYTPKVKYNAAGACTLTLPAKTINSPAPIIVNTTQTLATCLTGAKVDATTTTGGTGAYTIQLKNTVAPFTVTNFPNTLILTNVAPGTYTVIATDANGCAPTTNPTITIAAPVSPTATIDPTSNLCFDPTTGANIIVKVAGGVGPYTYKSIFNGGIPSAASPTFAGPTFTYNATVTGTYSFEVYDSYGCKATTANQIINAKLTANTAVLPGLDCDVAPADQAVITGTISGGTAPFTVTLLSGNATGTLVQPIASGNTFTYSIAVAGTYNFQIKDANNCVTTKDAVINAKTPVTGDAVVTNETCETLNNGSVTLQALTGVAPFTYNFNNLGFVNTVTYGSLAGSVAGTSYPYQIKDNKGCIFDGTAKVFEPKPIALTANISTPYTCDNAAIITASATDGNGGFTYVLKRGATTVASNTTGIFSGLSVAGSYTVTVTDAKGCPITSAAMVIDALNPPKAMTISNSLLTCPTNKANVSITDVKDASGTLLVGPFTYAITAPAAATSNISGAANGIFTNLDPSTTYTFEVKDAKNCTYSKPYTITPLPVFTVSLKSFVDETCLNAADGSAIFTVSGLATGEGYSYKIDSGSTTLATSTGTSFDIPTTGLSVGSHTITVTNSTTKCFVVGTVSIAGAPAVLQLNPSILTHVTCLANGTATINAVGGWGTYTYTVTPKLPIGPAIVQVTNNKFIGLGAGTYSVSVKDLSGCPLAGSDFTINDKVLPSASINATSNYCAGGAGATLVVTPTVAPQPNYRYSINGSTPQVSGTFSGLTPGAYDIVVSDITTGCTLPLAKQTINSPVTASTKLLKDLDCDATNPEASIEVTIADGYPDYKYRANTIGAPFTGPYSPVGVGLKVFTYPAATAGTYYFEITDNNGCTTVVSRTINALVKPDFSTTQVNVKCKTEATGSITVTGIPASGTYTYSNDNGVTFQASNVFATLLAGPYQIVVKDAKKCPSLAKTVTITEPSVGLTATAGVTTKLSCGVGNASQAATITVTAQDGTPYSGVNKYRYSYNGILPAVTSNTYTTNTPGAVTVDVYDANGCSYSVPVAPMVDALNPPTALAFTPANSITCDPLLLDTDLTVTVTDGVAPFKFEITSTDAAVAPSAPVATGILTQANTFANLVSGTYFFKVTDANNCTKTGQFTIDPVVPIQASGAIATNVTCYGAADGVLKFTVSGNTAAAYTYTLVGSVSGTITGGVQALDIITYSGLKGGETYTFTVTNTTTKCTAIATVPLSQPAAITALAATASKVFCAPNVKSTIKVTASGGTAPLQFAVVISGNIPVAADYNTTGVFIKDTSVDGLLYDAYVIDKNGNCSQHIPVSVVQDAAPTVGTPAAQCYSGTPFTITMTGTVFGGSSIKYGINGVYTTNPVKTISAAGSYNLTVKDDNGCISPIVIYDVKDQLTISTKFDKDLTCAFKAPFTTNDAQVTLSAGGGTGTYSYEYKVGTLGTYLPVIGNVYNPTVAGDYYFRVTSGGCIKETVVPVKVNPIVLPQITGVSQTQSIKCNGDETAAISIAIDNTKGLAPYVFNVSLYTDATYTTLVKDYGTQTSGLAAGDYRITVTDAKGCTNTRDINIGQPLPINVSFTPNDITCVTGSGISKGSIVVNSVTGGTGSYTYQVSNNTGYISPIVNSNGILPETFNLIDFGNYQLTIIDANGCSWIKQDISIASPPTNLDLVVTPSTPVCGALGSAEVKVAASLAGPLGFFFAIYKPGIVYTVGDPAWFPEDGLNSLKTTIPNLIPGVTYTFIVYDDNTKCYYFETFTNTVPSGSSLTSTATSVPITCRGSADGSVNLNITSNYGVNINVKYEIFNSATLLTTGIVDNGVVNANSTLSISNFGAKPLYSGLPYGTYYVLIEETSGPNTGCTITTLPFSISESAVDLSLTASSPKNDNCKNNAGEVAAIPSGGTGPFLYQIVTDNGAIGFGPGDTQPTSASFVSPTHIPSTFNVESGNYIVWVKDANGCIKDATATVVLDPDPVFALTVPNKCATEGNFAVDVVVTDPIPSMAPYAVSVNGGTFENFTGLTYSATGLNSGTQTIVIQDKNGCPIPHTIDINATPLATAVVSKVLDCSLIPTAVEDATITVTITKGTTPYSYEVKKGSGAYTTITPIVNVAAGVTTFDYPVASIDADTYQFRITDNNTCAIETNPVIVDPIIPIVPAFTPTQPLCNGGTGTIELAATGGQGAYTYSFNGSGFTSTTVYSVLAGTYPYIIKDALGCEVTGSAVLGQPSAVAVGTPIITPLSCGPGNLGQDAIVDLSGVASGGSGAFEYSFNGSAFTSQTSYNVSDTNADQLGIPFAVQDANGCTASGTVDIFKLNPPTNFDITQARPITCTDLNSNVTLSNFINGVAPLTYQIISSTGSPIIDNINNPTFANLLPGSYVFQVKDANGCVKQLPYEIKDVIKIDIVAQSTAAITCFSDTDGKASFLVSGFGTGVGTYHYEVDGVAVASNVSSPTIDLINLVKGPHTIEVFDDATICSKLIPFTIDAPTAVLALDPLNVTPLGCTTFGAVTIVAKGGWGTYEYTVTPPVGPALINNTGDFGGLTQAGLYTIVVKDANGCMVNDSFNLITPTPPTAIIAATSDYCYDGTNAATLVVTASGGAGGYEYSINNGTTWQLSDTFNNLSPGSYDITVKDAYGCTVVVSNNDIKSQLFATAQKTKDLFCTGTTAGTIKIDATGGYGSYTYTVNKDGLGASAPIAFPVGLDTVNYSVTGPGSYAFVVYDAKGCSFTVVDAIVMVDPTPVTYIATPTAPSCTGAQGNVANGSIDVVLGASNDNFDYKFEITRTLPSVATTVTQTSGLFTGLIAGTYNVLVTSARGCSTPDTVIIADPNPVVASATASAFTCSAPNTINQTTVTVTGTGGAGTGAIADYRYSEDGINWKTTNTFVLDNALPQNPTYYVKDANGCIDDVQIAIAAFPKLTSAVASFGSAIDCLNNKQAMDVVINGGTNAPNPFTYNVYQDGLLIQGPTNVVGATFTYDALVAGSFYEFEIIDNNTLCSIKSNALTVPNYKTMTVTASAFANVDCATNTTGTIEINVTGYSGTYDYEVYDGVNPLPLTTGSHNMATSNPFVIPFGLGAGNTYTVKVIETAFPSCPATSNVVIITEPAVLDLSAVINVVNQNCSNFGATITVPSTSVTGGTLGYMYAFVPSGSSPTGLYTTSNTKTIVTSQIAPLFDAIDVYVQDANLCTDKQTVNISVDPLPTVTATVASQCANPAGYTINVVGTGIGTLEYSLDGNSFQTATSFNVNTPGTYTVTVRDANQCTATSILPAIIIKPLGLQGVVSNPRSCNALPDGEITLTASDGSGLPNYEYSKDGITYVSSNVFSGLAAGTYTMYVRDIGTSLPYCVKSVQVIIDVPSVVTGMVLKPINVSCQGSSDGSITVALDPSTLTVNNNPDYNYSLTGTTLNPLPLGVGVSRPNQLSNVFDNLEAGTYTITTTSSRGCQDSKTITIIEPATIAVPTPVVVDYACSVATPSNTMNLATITVNPPSGGSGTYPIYEFVKGGTVVQSGSSNVYTQTDLSGGVFTVNVYDTKGCLGTTSATINPFVSIDFAATAINITKAITCVNDEDIQVNVTTTGIAVPMPTLIYNVKGVNAGNTYDVTDPVPTGTFTGLPIGDYLVTVTNPVTGCSIQTMHYVNNPNTFDLQVVNKSDVICFGSNEGSVELTFIDRLPLPTDESGPYSYVIKDATGAIVRNGNSTNAAPELITGLTAGTYSVTATLTSLTSPQCTTALRNFTINQPIQALAISETHTAITCANNDGSISVSAIGGWSGDYVFQLEEATLGVISSWSPTTDYNGLIAGNYIVKVKDSKTCERQVAIALVNPTPINTTIVVDKPTLNCFGDTNATITVNSVNGGSGTYNYSLEATYPNGIVTLDGPQVSNVFNNLGAASYKVIVSDTWTCSGVSNTLVINQPTVVTASLVQMTVQTCLNPATLTLSAVGGTGPYTYSADPNFATVLGSFANSTLITVPFTAVAVNPIFYVKDQNGCTSYGSNSVSVAPLEPLDFKFENDAPYISCFGDNNGQITAIAKGGSGNYIYTLLDSAGNLITPTPVQPTPGYFTQLAAGNYLMDVKSGDCTIARKPITITEPKSALIYTPTVTDVTCNGNGDGKLILTASGGTGIIKFALSPDLDKFVEDGTFMNLVPGTYKAIIQDVRGCNHIYDFEIKEPQPIDAKVDPLSVKQELCAGEKTGEFGIVITGGVAPYSTSLDDSKGTYILNKVTFTGLSGGDHTVYIKDANLCTFELLVPLDPAVILNPVAKVSNECVNDLPANKVTVTIDPSNVPADVKYSLDSTGVEQDSNVFTNLTPGDHFIMVHHKNGCVDATDTFTIDKIDPLTISIDLGGLNEIVATVTGGSGVYRYTVNGEDIGSNNKYIYFRSGDYTVTVTDSNGCSVSATKYFEFIDIKIPNVFTPNGSGTNDNWKPTNTENYPDIKFIVYDRYGREVGIFGSGESWDGKYNGKELPMGDYWYVLKLRHSQDDREFIGHFTLYR